MASLKAAVALSGMALAAGSYQPFTVAWNGASGGTWSTCADWSAGFCPLPCAQTTVDSAVTVVRSLDQEEGSQASIITEGPPSRVE